MVDLLAYTMEVQWCIICFSFGGEGATNGPRISSGRVTYRHGDGFDFGKTSKSFALHIRPDTWLGQSKSGEIRISIADDNFFLVDLIAGLDEGVLHREIRLTARPQSQIPFMLTVAGQAPNMAYDEDTTGTKVTLHGVIATARRPIDTIATFRG